MDNYSPKKNLVYSWKACIECLLFCHSQLLRVRLKGDFLRNVTVRHSMDVGPAPQQNSISRTDSILHILEIFIIRVLPPHANFLIVTGRDKSCANVNNESIEILNESWTSNLPGWIEFDVIYGIILMQPFRYHSHHASY